MTISRRRGLMFAAFCACFIAIAVAYVSRARVLSTPTASVPGDAAPVAASLAALRSTRGILFSSAAFDSTNGHLGFESSGPAGAERHRIALRCERVHVAAGVGICLAVDRGVISKYWAHTFGDDFEIRHTLPLAGLPSRTRVSPDGRLGATTVFVSGDSYNSTGFSTRTTLLDMATGRVIADLEEFAVTRNGAPFKAIDFNFWGVTFARDSNRFFATLQTGGTIYLVEGNVNARTARVVREGVECPSLSPDNTRIVFKARVSAASWRLHLLDLATLRDTPLAETRNVDDQAEWLDDETVAYMLPDDTMQRTGGADVWAVSVDGDTQPRRLVRAAYSPVAIR
jgi:hypothetical protein